MSSVLTIARRELAAFFGRPQAWILGGTFALLGGYLFYSEVAFFEVFGGNRLTTGLWPFVFLDLRLVAFFVVPLWFAEGMAEWLSEGWTSEAEMFVRDGIITGYLPPLPYSGGFLAYKQGQAAMRFLTELVHRHPHGAWARDVEELYEMLQHVGPEAMHRAFRAALDVGRISTAFVAECLGRPQTSLFPAEVR